MGTKSLATFYVGVPISGNIGLKGGQTPAIVL